MKNYTIYKALNFICQVLFGFTLIIFQNAEIFLSKEKNKSCIIF
jgi:hypothetical protein